MGRKIFVNLPIGNMERTQAFFRSLGFSFNPQFSNEQGACHGFMYGHGFEDLDGHQWELTYMDPNAVPPQA